MVQAPTNSSATRAQSTSMLLGVTGVYFVQPAYSKWVMKLLGKVVSLLKSETLCGNPFRYPPKTPVSFQAF